MSDSIAIIADGTTFYRGGTVPAPSDPTTETVWTEVPDVTDIDGPEFGRNMIDTTHLKSPNNEPEFKGGRKARGTVTLNISYDPSDTTQAGFATDAENDVIRCYGKEYNNDAKSNYIFRARVESVKVMTRGGDVVKATVTLRPTGQSVRGSGKTWS